MNENKNNLEEVKLSTSRFMDHNSGAHERENNHKQGSSKGMSIEELEKLLFNNIKTANEKLNNF